MLCQLHSVHIRSSDHIRFPPGQAQPSTLPAATIASHRIASAADLLPPPPPTPRCDVAAWPCPPAQAGHRGQACDSRWNDASAGRFMPSCPCRCSFRRTISEGRGYSGVEWKFLASPKTFRKSPYARSRKKNFSRWEKSDPVKEDPRWPLHIL